MSPLIKVGPNKTKGLCGMENVVRFYSCWRGGFIVCEWFDIPPKDVTLLIRNKISHCTAIILYQPEDRKLTHTHTPSLFYQFAIHTSRSNNNSKTLRNFCHCSIPTHQCYLCRRITISMFYDEKRLLWYYISWYAELLSLRFAWTNNIRLGLLTMLLGKCDAHMFDN